MYNVQIILAHNKQTHFQPIFFKNNTNYFKNHQQTKIFLKISHLPSLTLKTWIWIAPPTPTKNQKGNQSKIGRMGVVASSKKQRTK